MRRLQPNLSTYQFVADVVERYSAEALEVPVLGGDLAGAVVDSPWQMKDDHAEPLPPRANDEIDMPLERIDGVEP